MAPDSEKVEGAGAETMTSTALKEQNEKSAQGSSEDGSPERQSDRDGSQNDHSSQDSEKTVLGTDRKQKQEAELEAGGNPEGRSKSGNLETIPRSQRRGFFGRFTLVPEVVNPYEYKNATKWMMTVFVALAATTSSTGSSISYRRSIIRDSHRS